MNCFRDRCLQTLPLVALLGGLLAPAARSQTAPAAPDDLRVSMISSNQIMLTWMDRSEDEAGFHIERKAATDADWGDLISVAADVTGFLDEGLVPATWYAYRVRAHNAFGASDWTPARRAATAGRGLFLRSTVETGGQAMGLCLNGPYAYVADGGGGMAIIDIGNPDVPLLIRSIPVPGGVNAIFITNGFAYVAAFMTGNEGMHIYDLADPENPVWRSTYPTISAVWDVVADAQHAFLATESDGLHIVAVNDPDNPTFTAQRVGIPGYRLHLQEPHLYVAGRADGMRVLDVSVRNNPLVISDLAPSDGGQFWDVFVQGAHAYLADLFAGLQVVNVGDPSSPVLSGASPETAARSVVVAGPYAYVADDSPVGIKVFDVADPYAPALLAWYDGGDLGHGRGIRVQGKHAYLTVQDQGLKILELRFAPEIVNQPPIDIAPDSAGLNYHLLTAGLANTADIMVFWGATDGETDPAAWSDSAPILDAMPGTGTEWVSDLMADTRYYYRTYAQNVFGDAWAPDSMTFQTPPAGMTGPSLRLTVEPSTLLAGQRATLTVSAWSGTDRWETYEGEVFFGSEDATAELPPDYRFVAADTGEKTFPNALRMNDAGRWLVSVHDLIMGMEAGREVEVVVGGAAATTHLEVRLPRPLLFTDVWYPMTVIARGEGNLVNTNHAEPITFAAPESEFAVDPFDAWTNGIARLPDQVRFTTPGRHLLRVEQTSDPTIFAEIPVTVVSTATVWYVDVQHGSGTHSGAAPDDAWHSIDYGLSLMAQGDTLIVAGGEYWEPTLTFTAATSTGPQTLIMADNEGHYFGRRGPVAVFNAFGNPLLQLDGQHDITVHGFTFQGITGANNIEITGGNNITLRHCESIEGSQGIIAAGVNGLHLDGCVVRDATGNGIRIEGGENVAVTGCEVNDCDTGIHLLGPSATIPEIRGTRVMGCSRDGIRVTGLKALIVDCLIGWNMNLGIYVEMAAGSAAELIRNRVIDNQWEGIAINTTEPGNLLLNNTAAGNHTGLWLGGGADVQARNNIIAFNTTVGIQVQFGNLSNDYNCVHGNGTNDWVGAGPGPNDIDADPLFAGFGDYHLQSVAGRWTPHGYVIDAANSPCIDAGDPLDPFDREPPPNGGRINMGAYGNTRYASKSGISDADVFLHDLDQTYDGTARAVWATTDPPDLDTLITYNGSPTPPTNAGTYFIQALVDDITYQGTATGTLTIARATPWIAAWPTATAIVYGQSLAAAALSGGAVEVMLAADITNVVGGFEYDNPTVTPDAQPAYPAAVTFVPDDTINYETVPISVEVAIQPAPATITLADLTHTYDGTPKSATATTTPIGLPVTLTYEGNPDPPTAAGDYAVAAVIDDPNYDGNAADTLTITQATPVITAWPTASTIVYGQSLADSVLTNGIADVGGVFQFDDATDMPDANPAYPAAVTFVPDDAMNYESIAGGGLVEIQPAPATITLTDLDQIYDGTPKEATASTDPPGLPVLLTYDGGAAPPTDAGVYAVAASIDDPNYDGSSTDTLTIARKALTVTDATADDKVYDGTADTSISGAILNGVLGADDVTLDALTGQFSQASAGAGIPVTALLTLTGTDSANYTLVQPTGLTADISPRMLTIEGDFSVSDKVYDGTTAATIIDNNLTLVMPIAADDVALAPVAAFADAEVGTAKPVLLTDGTILTGADSGNYTLALDGAPTTIATIGNNAVTVGGTFTVADKNYDRTTAATIIDNNLTLDGVQAGDTVTLIPVAVFGSRHAGIEKTVILSAASTLGGPDAGNYVLSLAGAPTATADIEPAQLTVTGASADDKIYDGTADASVSGAALNGVVGADDVSLGSLDGQFAQASAGVGIPVTALLTLTGADSANYTLIQPTGLSAAITPREVTVGGGFTVSDKVYDGATDATLIDSNLVLIDIVTGADVALAPVVAFADAEVGIDIPVSLTGGTLLVGPDAGNYTLSLADAPTTSATIEPAELTVASAAADDKVYDGTAAASISGAALTGVVGADDVVLDALAGQFAQVSAGVDIPVTALLTLTGADSANYTLIQPTALSAAITPREVTVGGGFTVSDKVYDGTTDATVIENNLVLIDIVTGDDVVLTPVAAFADAEVSIDIPVSLTGDTLLVGTDAGNYILSLTGAPATTARIGNNALTVSGTFAAADKVYDGTTAAILTEDNLVLDGIQDGDTVVLLPAVVFETRAAGTGKTVILAAASTLDGPDAGNYVLSLAGAPTATADIDPAELTVTDAAADDKPYDGTVAATLSGAILNGLIGGDNVMIAAAAGLFAQATVGDAIAVTAALTLGGAHAGNYNLIQPAGLSASITQREVTVGGGFTVSDKVYDGTIDATLIDNHLALLNVVTGDDVAIDPAVAFEDAGAGIDKPAALTGATTLTGADAVNYVLSLAGAPASVADIFQANQTIDFPPVDDAWATDTVMLDATADSGLPVGFTVAAGPAVLAGPASPTTMTFTDAGAVTIVATQAGDANWNAAAPVSHTFQVRHQPPAGVIYVHAAASGADTGASWADAFTDLQHALAAAAYGEEIWVAAGTYRPTADPLQRTATFALRHGIALYGGFSGDETQRHQRDWTMHRSILSGAIGGGNNVYHVVTGADNAVLDGFVVRNGRADGPVPNGGGMLNRGVSPIVLNCTFVDNHAAQRGGGMANLSAAPLVKFCAFEANTAGYWGGAIYQGGQTEAIPVLLYTTFTANSAAFRGGAVAVFDATPHLGNCHFSGNRSMSGGAIHGVNATLALENCTLTRNHATIAGGGWFSDASTAMLRNAIFWHNTAPTGAEITTGGGETIRYSVIRGGWSGGFVAGSLIDGGGNLDVDPRFAGGPTGIWSANAVMNAAGGVCALTAAGAGWTPNALRGKRIQPDIASTQEYEVLGNTATTLWVAADLSAHDLAGRTFQIHDDRLQSTIGRWEPGLEIWVSDAIDSPCIDAGDPASAHGNEPMPNGGRINIGVYGNTAQASLSPAGYGVGAFGFSALQQRSKTVRTLSGHPTSGAPSSTEIVTHWPAITGWSYTMETTTDPATGAWEVLPHGTDLQSASGTITFSLPNDPASRRFYRIRAKRDQ